MDRRRSIAFLVDLVDDEMPLVGVALMAGQCLGSDLLHRRRRRRRRDVAVARLQRELRSRGTPGVTVKHPEVLSTDHPGTADILRRRAGVVEVALGVRQSIVDRSEHVQTSREDVTHNGRMMGGRIHTARDRGDVEDVEARARVRLRTVTNHRHSHDWAGRRSIGRPHREERNGCYYGANGGQTDARILPRAGPATAHVRVAPSVLQAAFLIHYRHGALPISDKCRVLAPTVEDRQFSSALKRCLSSAVLCTNCNLTCQGASARMDSRRAFV